MGKVIDAADIDLIIEAVEDARRTDPAEFLGRATDPNSTDPAGIRWSYMREAVKVSVPGSPADGRLAEAYAPLGRIILADDATRRITLRELRVDAITRLAALDHAGMPADAKHGDPLVGAIKTLIAEGEAATAKSVVRKTPVIAGTRPSAVLHSQTY